MHLERCMRIYPHLQDTGGFFVAVFQSFAPACNPERPPATISADAARAAMTVPVTAAAVVASEADEETAARAEQSGLAGEDAEAAPGVALSDSPRWEYALHPLHPSLVLLVPPHREFLLSLRARA